LLVNDQTYLTKLFYRPVN